MMDTLFEALKAYNWKECPATAERYGHGHINVTYVIPAPDGARYILQKVNKNVFKKPVELMENVAAVTNYLSARTDDPRGCLRLIPTKDGENFFTDSNGDYWRVYVFITDSICLQQAESGEDFRQSAIAFGEFQKQLKDFPAHTLHEVIPHFHDTKDRYRMFKEAIANNKAGRADSVREEIDFYLAREDFAGLIVDKLADGSLPLRVTHNDTKLNNVMLDKRTRKALCVIDLDTVMPGSALYDYGDSIRFGASSAAEDETDLSKVTLDLDLFRLYAKGFLEPIPVMLPMNLISEVATPVSMSFRHFGNVLSGSVISALVAWALQSASAMLLGWLPGFLGTIPFLQVGLPAILSLYFDIFSGLMQAFIFAMLTMLYIATAGPEEA